MHPVARAILAVVALCLVLVAYNTLRVRDFSNDSMNYVNVARSVSSGRGLTQPTLGFNQARFSVEDEIPAPFTAQAPLFPVLIASLAVLGVPHSQGALLIPVLSYGCVLVLAFLLVRELYGKGESWLCLGLLLAYQPLRFISGLGWSESTGIGLILLSLLLLVKTPAPAEGAVRMRFIVAAGFVGGLAFAVRYALSPILAAGALFLAVRARQWKQGVAGAVSYTVGFGIPAALVLGRNWALTGAFMPTQNPSREGWADNFGAMMEALGAGYLDPIPPHWQLRGLAVALGAATVAVLVNGRLRASVRATLADRRARVLALWCVGYLTFLLAQRTRFHFDSINVRLVAPAGVVLAMLMAAVLARATGIRIAAARWCALLLASVSLLREARLVEAGAADGSPAWKTSAARLTWIADNVSERDLVIGDDTIDVPFFLDRAPHTVSFSPYPYTDRPTYASLTAYLRRHGHRYRSVYLVVREHGLAEAEWTDAYGPFVADLLAGRLHSYPDISPVRRLSGTQVFRIRRS